ncbi:MAG: Crp/Fnr family transcriptional regulator [Microscillaceae bacterium]|nr:Crp/Fnr family transcriptional regulator [Microscillaceae bacterium]
MGIQGIWYLEDVNLFKVFCPHKYAAFKKSHEFKNVKKEQFVYFKEDLSNKIYLIADGKVKIGFYTHDGREVVKAILSKGEIFGEMAFLGEERRTDFAQSLDDKTSLCPLNIESMHALMRDDKPFSFKIYKLIGFRIQKLERRIEALISKDVKTRLIDFLKEMAEERGKLVGDETLIEHHLTQKDIGDLIGSSRQTVTTLLNELKEINLIYFDRKRILIRDMKKLDQFVLQASS